MNFPRWEKEINMIELSERSAVALSAAAKCLWSTAGALKDKPVDKWARAIDIKKEAGDTVQIDVSFWMFRSPGDVITISVILVKVKDEEWKEFVATMTPHDKKTVIWDFDPEGKPIERK